MDAWERAVYMLVTALMLPSPATALGLLPSIALSSELADGKYHRRKFFQQKKGQQNHRPRQKKADFNLKSVA